MTLRTYLVNRVSRLYPLHVVTLLAVALLQEAFRRAGHGISFVYPFNDLRHFGLQLLMLSHWGLQQGFSFNGPVWSVSVEEFCYLAFFFVASGLSFNRRTFPMVVAAAWVLVATRVIHPDFAECLALFFVGGAVWGAYEWAGGRRWLLWTSVALGTIAAVLGWSAFDAFPPLMQMSATHFVLIPALLMAFLALSPADGTRGARLCGELGKLTYATYMIHFPLQLASVLVVDALGLSRALFYSPFALMVFVVSVLLLGQLVFTRFERPMQAWMRRRLLRGDAEAGLESPDPRLENG